jgi:ferredoxin
MAVKKDFGFAVQDGRHIDLDLAFTGLTRELDEAVPAWNTCIGCGSCSASCPAGINFRQFHYGIRQSVVFPTERQLATLHSCLLCGKCQLVCPRGIPTRYLSIQIMQINKRHAENIPSL